MKNQNKIFRSTQRDIEKDKTQLEREIKKIVKL